MSTNKDLKQELARQEVDKKTALGSAIKQIMADPAIKKRFEEVLKARSAQYMSSIVNLVNSDQNLMKCNAMSIIASCMVAAAMDLPVDKNLGYAWIIPYKGVATFQMGYKGYVQLALRTGKYKAINAIPVHEGELIAWNPLTEELEIDFSKKASDEVVGYAGYFELINGFKKAVYWTKDEMEAHKKKYSKSGWNVAPFDAMAIKTVIRNMLSKWGILSIEMYGALDKDYQDPDSVKSQVDAGEIDIPDAIEADYEINKETGEVSEGDISLI